MRALATIQKIEDLQPIPNKDRIELATIGGWHAIVQKGQFKIGQLIVYIETDAILPQEHWCEFMIKYKYRVKTIRMGGVISQGLVFNIDILPKRTTIKEGEDVTDILGIKKYESNPDNVEAPKEKKPKSLMQKFKKWIYTNAYGNGYMVAWPSFLYKTDETRVQWLKALLEKKRGTVCYISEKMDGSSMTIATYNNEFYVCSRNYRLLLKEQVTGSCKNKIFQKLASLFNMKAPADQSDSYYWKYAKKHELEKRIKSLNRNIAIQGELIGPSIQKNKYKLDDYRFMAFNVFDIDKGEYFKYGDMISICVRLGIETVPIKSTKIVLGHTVDELIEMSKGSSTLNLMQVREGIVVRPVYDDRFSFKCINPEFLLGEDE